MLRKLLKYEFMSTARVFGLCYIGVLVAALLMRIFGDIAYTQNLQNGAGIFNVTEILTMTSTGFYFLMIAAVCVLTFVLILQRFWKNLMGSEGYLMHTLPVHAWQQIASKLIAAVVWTLLSGVVIVLSVMVLAMTGEAFAAILQGFGELLAAFQQEYGMPLVVILLELFLLGVAMIAASVLQIYAAIMIGHQANKHRVLLSVVVYFGIDMVFNVAFLMLISSVGLFPAPLMEQFGAFLAGLDVVEASQLMIWCGIGLHVVLCAAFFLICEFMMRRRLNLE